MCIRNNFGRWMQTFRGLEEARKKKNCKSRSCNRLACILSAFRGPNTRRQTSGPVGFWSVPSVLLATLSAFLRRLRKCGRAFLTLLAKVTLECQARVGRVAAAEVASRPISSAAWVRTTSCSGYAQLSGMTLWLHLQFF